MKEFAFKVVGMRCEGCLNKTIAALKAVPGVKKVELSLETGLGKVEAEGFVGEESLMNAVMGSGYAYLPQ